MDTNGSEYGCPLGCTFGASAPGGIHRQPRAVNECWARLATSLRTCTTSSGSPGRLTVDCASDSVHQQTLELQFCHRDRYAQCKLCRTPEIPQRSSWMVVDAPVVCDNRCRRWCRQFSLSGSAAVAVYPRVVDILLWRRVLAQCRFDSGYMFCSSRVAFGRIPGFST